MKPKFISPQAIMAIFCAFAIAVLAFAQYRMSTLDSNRRMQIARALTMPERRPTWAEIESKMSDNQSANAMFDRSHRYFVKEFQDKYPEKTHVIEKVTGQVDHSAGVRGLVPSAL